MRVEGGSAVGECRDDVGELECSIAAVLALFSHSRRASCGCGVNESVGGGECGVEGSPCPGRGPLFSCCAWTSQ